MIKFIPCNRCGKTFPEEEIHYSPAVKISHIKRLPDGWYCDRCRRAIVDERAPYAQENNLCAVCGEQQEKICIKCHRRYCPDHFSLANECDLCAAERRKDSGDNWGIPIDPEALTNIVWDFSKLAPLGNTPRPTINLHLKEDGCIISYHYNKDYKIEKFSQPSANRWEVKGDQLIFRNAKGRITTRFEKFELIDEPKYSPTDNTPKGKMWWITGSVWGIRSSPFMPGESYAREKGIFKRIEGGAK